MMRWNGFLSVLCKVVVVGMIATNAGCYGTNGWVWNRSGMKQYKRGHYAQARHRFARAIAHDPCNPDYRHNLAMAVQKQGDLAASERILRYNLSIDAMHQPTYHSLAQVMISQGHGAEAQELITSWAATQPYVPEANIELAWVQRESGDIAGAEQSLQNALRADPTHPIALAHLGQLYQTTGRADQAAAYYQRSLASNWDQPEVQSRLATLVDSRSMSRSALMQNPATAPMIADNPVLFNEPMLAANPVINGDAMIAGSPTLVTMNSMTMNSMPMDAPFGSNQQAIALEDPRANPRPNTRRHRHEREKDHGMATYPLPNFDATATAWQATSTVIGQPTMAFQPGATITDATMMPQLADGSANSLNAITPPSVPQADPAHLAPPEMTASLPVVDPR
jgi:Tfp pilus assembly protein PilF